MKAVDANLLELLKKSERFVVPIYQRVYSWERGECEQLWQDVLRAGTRKGLSNHFTGSIVYIERNQGTNVSREPDLIIDGQQRVTTVTLLLAALASRLDELPEGEKEPVPGFAPQKIRGLYLTNPFETGDAFFKLILTQRDKDALKAVVRDAPHPQNDSRVIANYNFFAEKLRSPGVDVAAVCRGLDKLVVVDVKLTRGADDPQLVFESMNATGKKLSQADLIRNFVLMDLPPSNQERLYEDYWFPMERQFSGENESRFDEFVRHYLTLKSQTNQIPRIDEIYEAFKSFAYEQEAEGNGRESLVVDLSRHASWFASMALGMEVNTRLRDLFSEIDGLATVAYPFELHLYRDYAEGRLSTDDFVSILESVLSYLFRRAICRIPTNSLNKTFATLATSIDANRYVESVRARLLTLPDYRRFPPDDEFQLALVTGDIYNMRRRSYFFRKLENFGRKEEVSTADYTIEHIMPQNANVGWQNELGPDWQETHDRYVHTLGNLTLTGYNPEYSDRLFAEKRDMKGGFRDSPLRLNQGLGQLPHWGAAEIEERAGRLAHDAASIWPRPVIEEALLMRYRTQFNDSRRFDWSQTHAILAAIPAGRWTGHYNLAEAVGTGPQAVASHISRCLECDGAHRVLTWNGAVSDEFHWHDAEDDRNPMGVLTEEGVKVVDGRADPEQQLDATELLLLVEEL